MLKPRIHGTEMEYSVFVQYVKDGGESIPSESIVRDVLTNYMPDNLHGLDSFYTNGSRMYVDIGDHAEYCTPEDTSFMGTVANEIAGEQLMYGGFQAAQQDDEFNAFVLNKRVVDYNGKTWGYHENYLVDAKEIEINEAHLALLGVHLATRNIFCGAGAVTNLPSTGPRFVISQKNARLTQDFHLATTQSSKPLVNLRDEAHADRSQWRRVHVTSGDPNLSPWATLMKLGTTSLVLRLTENDMDVSKLRSNYLCKIASQVALDTSLDKPLYLANGLLITAAEVQTELCDQATKLAEQVELPPEEQKVLALWQVACDEARNNPTQLNAKTDWGAKLQFLERYQDKHKLQWYDPRISVLDWQYDRISPSGLGMKLRAGRWSGDMPSNELIAERMFAPPQTTRAMLRAKFIGRALQHKSTRHIGLNWGQVTICDMSVKLNDPYTTKDPRFEQLMKHVDQLKVFPT